MIARVVAILFAALLAGCAGGKTITSIQGGESKVFEAPPYVVKGKARYDQNWIDSQVEGGVAAFGWPRPAPRPPEMDARPVAKKALPKKPAKQSFAKRFKDRVTAPFQAAPPVVASPPATVAPIPEPPAPPPPKPRDAVDELLDPSEPIRKVR